MKKILIVMVLLLELLLCVNSANATTIGNIPGNQSYNTEVMLDEVLGPRSCMVDNFGIIYYLEIGNGKITGIADNPYCASSFKVTGGYKGTGFRIHLRGTNQGDDVNYLYKGAISNFDTKTAEGRWKNTRKSGKGLFTLSPYTGDNHVVVNKSEANADIPGFWGEKKISGLHKGANSEISFQAASGSIADIFGPTILMKDNYNIEYDLTLLDDGRIVGPVTHICCGTYTTKDGTQFSYHNDKEFALYLTKDPQQDYCDTAQTLLCVGYRYDGGLVGTATLSGTWENISTESKPNNSSYDTSGYKSSSYPNGTFVMTAVASPGGVYGKVADFVTGAGIHGALVLLKDKEYTAEVATADSDGNYKLQNVWVGKEYTLIASADNYGSQSISVRMDKTEKDSGKRYDCLLREAVPPGVIVTNPSNGSSAISSTVVITATFSEPMDSNTINAATFLLGANASLVTGIVTYDADRNTATFTPSSKLSNNSTYIATITTGVKDKAGNSMQAAYQWSFNTEMNQAPRVNAGTDQNSNIVVEKNGAITALHGTVTDDGLPRNGILTTLWKQLSGPGTVSFDNASEVDTIARFTSNGVYVLELMADDGDLIGKDTVTIYVNKAPVVNAGTDREINVDMAVSLEDTAARVGAVCWSKKSWRQVAENLDASVTDDGLPVPPGAVTTLWSKLSGNGIVTFGNASAVDTTVSFSSSGIYVLELTASDGALTASDTVTFRVNSSPVVNAGNDQNSNFGDTVNLVGAAADDGLPIPPGMLTTLWTQESGDGTVTFGNASELDTTAGFSSGGIYVLKLTANDGALSTSDTVTIYVNMAPVVDAGTDQDVNFEPPADAPANIASRVGSPGPDKKNMTLTSVSLDGAVTDDDLPVPPGAFTTLWTQFSGTGTVSFGNVNEVDTTVSFSSGGIFVLELTANDGALTTSDTVTINVNTAPVVDAGPDQNVNVGATTILDGNVADDGLPIPPGALTTLWTQLSGPGTVSFGNAREIDTTASFSSSGVYVLELMADDGGLIAADTVTIFVNEATITLLIDAAGVQGEAPVSINGVLVGYLLVNEVSGYVTNTLNADSTLLHDGANQVVVSAPYSFGTDSYDDIQITNITLRKTNEEAFIFNDGGIYHIGDQSPEQILESYNSETWNDPNLPPFWEVLTGSTKTFSFYHVPLGATQ